MGYWDRTDDYLSKNGGEGPCCPKCGREMFPQDDHGRFACFCGVDSYDVATGSALPPMEIPQVDTSGMTNAQKANIPPMHRLHQPPTEAEKEFFRLAARGPEAMNDPAYQAACEALDEERRKASEQ